jgi:hypothetical protein
LRSISFGHLEADESGAMNQRLAVAPNSQVAHTFMGLHGVDEHVPADLVL